MARPTRIILESETVRYFAVTLVEDTSHEQPYCVHVADDFKGKLIESHRFFYLEPAEDMYLKMLYKYHPPYSNG